MNDNHHTRGAHLNSLNRHTLQGMQDLGSACGLGFSHQQWRLAVSVFIKRQKGAGCSRRLGGQTRPAQLNDLIVVIIWLLHVWSTMRNDAQNVPHAFLNGHLVHLLDVTKLAPRFAVFFQRNDCENVIICPRVMVESVTKHPALGAFITGTRLVQAVRIAQVPTLSCIGPTEALETHNRRRIAAIQRDNSVPLGVVDDVGERR